MVHHDDRNRAEPACLHRVVATVGAMLTIIGFLVIDPAFRRTPCNVLLITVDTLRADHLGCYGYPLQTSPAFDRLASRSAWTANGVSTTGDGWEVLLIRR